MEIGAINVTDVEIEDISRKIERDHIQKNLLLESTETVVVVSVDQETMTQRDLLQETLQIEEIEIHVIEDMMKRNNQIT